MKKFNKLTERQMSKTTGGLILEVLVGGTLVSLIVAAIQANVDPPQK